MKFAAFSLVICTICAVSLVHVSVAQISPDDFVKAHNKVRKEVGVVPISWNKTLAAKEEELAIPRISSCNVIEDPFGEIAVQASYPLTAAEAVALWASEKPYYDYDKNTCVGRNCEHYTQVVWNESVTVGCTRAQCRSGYWFISCRYYPEGNTPLERPYKKH
ncbi:unnamed protein product [Dovyalis caffra]|uniref:SCP domain-containing protein n=1 Tax=Dovyalis caffra TaxID=77055 RepID=A0AAV1RC83_9ROSI|nr:unnamed protein product [Dovyalis caffra]